MTKTYAGLSAESPQSSGKGRIPLIMLLPDGAGSGTQRIHHLVNLVKRSDHRETLLIEPRSIGLKSIMHQIQLGLQNLVVTLENANLNPHDCHNPIFTPGIFSGVGKQNEAARTKSAYSDEGSSPQILPKRRSGTHFPRFNQV
jgi:hypothetical protein